MTGPIVASSLLVLGLGLGTAWYVQHWQALVSQELRVNASGIRAAEELEILVREARTRLDYFLITGDRMHLVRVADLHEPIEHWLREAEKWGITATERRLTLRARNGAERFWAEFEDLRADAAAAGLTGRVRQLIDDVLVREMLEPAHEFLDVNEEEVKDSIEKNQAFADRLVWALLLLGTCGSVAGLLAGLGFARRLRRSLVQLSVLVRDTAGRLDAPVKPITFSGTDLAELESVLRLIGARVERMVQYLQQRERDAIRAEQFAALGQLAAGMAHELRNPLMAMKVLIQGANDGDTDSMNCMLTNRDLAVLDEEITRLEQLLQSFLDFARPPEPEKRVADVGRLTQQTVGFLSGRVAELGSTIECVVPPEPAYAAVDGGQFRQVLLNLVLNALEAMPGGGTIQVEVRGEMADRLTIEVADRGCGLPHGLEKGIFEPFTTTKETGLGLGLSTCKRIAIAHGGTLNGANRRDGGAVFTFGLARAEAPELDLAGTTAPR